MKYLVVGNAQMETITQSETGLSRDHAGGVGAIMARELALAGADVTLISTAPSGPTTTELEDALSTLGVNPVIVPGSPAQRERGYTHITTQNGGPISARGEWPRMGGVISHLNRMKADWMLTSLHAAPQDLSALSRMNRKNAVNATSKKHVRLITHIWNQTIYTMNDAEARMLMKEIDIDRLENLPRALGAETVMVTRGRYGRITYTYGKDTQRREAVPVPEGTDFIGCGDAATAGLVFATAEGLDVPETVDRFITDLMERNRLAYIH